MPDCVAVLLAAGESRRMGTPKALLRLGGETLAAAHARRLAEVARRVVVVASARLSPEELALPDGALFAISSASDAAGSLAAGLAVLRRRGLLAPFVIVAPVDMLPVERSTLAALVANLGAATDAVSPVFGGRGGHPIAARSEALGPYLAARPPFPVLRDHLLALGSRRLRLEVDDPSVVAGFNTRSELDALKLPPACAAVSPAGVDAPQACQTRRWTVA